MLSCWSEDQSQRPTFHTLKSRFNDILLSMGSESYIDFNIDPEKLCFKEDDLLDIDLTEDDSDLPPMTNFQAATTNTRRGRSVSVCTLPQLMLEQRRASESTAANEPKGTNLLDKFKNKFHPSGEDRELDSASQQGNFVVPNPDILVESVNRYVSNPAVTMRATNGMFDDSLNGILGAPVVILANTEAHSQ